MTERRYRTDLEDGSNSNGWSKWKVYVLETIDKIEEKVDKVEDQRRKCQLECTQELTKLKVKSSIWGGLAGFIGSVVVTLVISITAGFITTNIDIGKRIQQDNTPKIEQQDKSRSNE